MRVPGACARRQNRRIPWAAATVSFTNKLAVVAFDTNRTTLKALQQVIVEAGYGAKPVRR